MQPEKIFTAFLLLQPFLVIVLAIYDMHTHRIPNLVTLPWLVLSVILGLLVGSLGNVFLRLLFPLVLAGFWQMGVLGGGDAKMWMALWFTTPGEVLAYGLLVSAACFVIGGWAATRKHGKGVPVPSAWWALPYALFLAGAGWL